MRNRRVSNLPKNAGVTILELLIVIALLALIAGVIGTSVRPQFDNTKISRSEITQFLDRVVYNAISSGQPAILIIETGGISTGRDILRWNSSEVKIQNLSGSRQREYHIVVFSDGTVSGPDITIKIAGDQDFLFSTSRSRFRGTVE